jgi:hypothetical protein
MFLPTTNIFEQLLFCGCTLAIIIVDTRVHSNNYEINKQYNLFSYFRQRKWALKSCSVVCVIWFLNAAKLTSFVDEKISPFYPRFNIVTAWKKGNLISSKHSPRIHTQIHTYIVSQVELSDNKRHTMPSIISLILLLSLLGMASGYQCQCSCVGSSSTTYGTVYSLFCSTSACTTACQNAYTCGGSSYNVAGWVPLNAVALLILSPSATMIWLLWHN